MRDRRKNLSDYLIAASVVVTAIGLITQSAAVSKGIGDGLRICAGVLIPALFPFMALSSYISLTSAARILSIPLEPVTTKIFKLPKELGAVVLLSLIGGYPVGAKSISLLLSQKKIEKHTAERMLCFCVNSGPSFLITAVGCGMLFNKAAGIILFFTQTAATLLIGAIVSAREKIPDAGDIKIEMRGSQALVAAVSGASSSMIAMCSFTVLFSGILSLISAGVFVLRAADTLRVSHSVLDAVIKGFFEVTAGCVSATRLGGITAFALISALVSFGGLSVLFQIMSCFREEAISFKPLILARVLHIPLSTSMAALLYFFFCETQTVFATATQPLIHTDTRSIIVSVSLLCMCVAMTLSGRQKL